MNLDLDSGEFVYEYIEEQRVLLTKMHDRSIMEWSGSSRGSLRESKGMLLSSSF